ncbi:hypothetical protein AYJ54_04540 [Bradyrhizobium centrolobii]|uniref:Uncharacterized protein n=1 Tax=Bradyrhizobium centrolobii TaxID=1505087 RepID=A0A176Y9H2_9BRAD|nr:hypothetical protein [Bradyrhizobium centrolobii]OAE98014.1 hypothetical protein AYJ54_04540 [Bradyrhizobium centrolobii]
MSDDAKDAGLVAMISSILGGGKRADVVEPPPLAEVPPTAPTSVLEADASQVPEATLPRREGASNGVVASVKMAGPVRHVVMQPDGKRRLPAEAIADLVLGELRKIEEFPASGVSVTVYGYRNWNAMITFAPFSTTFRNATRFRQRLPDIVFKLRRYVDLEI